MKKMVIAMVMVGGLAVLLFAAAPASLFAEEYSLDDLCRIALTRSEKLKVAEENLTIAEIGKDKAFSYLLPRLTATGGVTQYSEKKFTATGSVIQPETASSWGVRVGRDRLPERPGTDGARDLQAERDEEPAMISRPSARTISSGYVAAAYYNVLMARKSPGDRRFQSGALDEIPRCR